MKNETIAVRKIAPDVKLGKIGQDRIHNGLFWEHSEKELYEAYEMVFSEWNCD